MQLTDYHAKYFAHELTKRCPSDSAEKLAGALVCKNKRDVLRTTLVKEGCDFLVAPDDGLAFVDIDVAGELCMPRPGRALLRGMKNERNEETSEKL